jgi:hypothetical protein
LVEGGGRRRRDQRLIRHHHPADQRTGYDDGLAIGAEGGQSDQASIGVKHQASRVDVVAGQIQHRGQPIGSADEPVDHGQAHRWGCLGIRAQHDGHAADRGGRDLGTVCRKGCLQTQEREVGVRVAWAGPGRDQQAVRQHGRVAVQDGKCLIGRQNGIALADQAGDVAVRSDANSAEQRRGGCHEPHNRCRKRRQALRHRRRVSGPDGRGNNAFTIKMILCLVAADIGFR